MDANSFFQGTDTKQRRAESLYFDFHPNKYPQMIEVWQSKTRKLVILSCATREHHRSLYIMNLHTYFDFFAGDF